MHESRKTIERARRVAPAEPSAVRTSDADVPLEALSAASASRGSSAAPPPHRAPRPSLILSFLVGVAVCAVVAWVPGFDYRVMCRLATTPHRFASSAEELRRDLLARCLERGAGLAAGGVELRSCTVSAEPGALVLESLVSERAAGAPAVSAVAEDFINAVRERVHARRTQPSEAEKVLAAQVEAFERLLSRSESAVKAAVAALPQDDPRVDREALLSKWGSVHTEFDESRSELEQARLMLSRLESQTMPERGVVSEEARRRAIAAHDALQQDLRELGVNLSELRGHLLTARRKATPAMEKLLASCDALVAACEAETDGLLPSTREMLIDMGNSSKRYTALLTPFRAVWQSRFDEIQRREIDPETAAMLDDYGDLRKSLSDFLFQAARSLSEARDVLSQLAGAQTDSAVFHQAHARVARAFHEMQTAHHRFEFAASEVEAANNFRLEAAYRTARGLHRRCRQRLEVIGQRLEVEAVETARVELEQKRKTASNSVERARAAADATVEELVALQSKLNLTVAQTESFQAALAELEAARGGFRSMETAVAATVESLEELKSARLAEPEDPGVRLDSLKVAERPENLQQRAQVGGIAGAAAFVLVFGCQWWMTRRMGGY